MSPGLRLGLAPWGEDLAELTAACARAEAAGASAVWLPELHRSASIPLAAAALATSQIRVGSAIMWAFVRSPMATALEALDLDELSDGRLVLGLGTGVRRLIEDWHDVPWEHPAARMRDTIRNVRHFVAHAHEGEPMDLGGELAPMRIRGYARPTPPRRTEIPIHVAAMGPVMTRLAGEIGDGWIAHELGSPGHVREHALPLLAQGLEKAGRDRSALEVVVSACCVPDEDPRQARRWAAGIVAFYATVRTYEPFFEAHGFLHEARAVQAAFRAGDEAGMVAAVPDAMVDALTIAGSPDEVRRRIAEYEGLADAIKLHPPTHFVPPGVTRHVQDTIIELLEAP